MVADGRPAKIIFEKYSAAASSGKINNIKETLLAFSLLVKD